MRDQIRDNVKNIPGWRTKRKLIAFVVDDYGCVRLASRAARDSIEAARRAPITQRFDRFDALESREDLEMLAEVLSSVRDSNARAACFTPYVVSRNVDFDQTLANGCQELRLQTLRQTVSEMEQAGGKAYQGLHEAWQEMVATGLFRPQFHGSEHFNPAVLSKALSENHPLLKVALENNSLACLEALPRLGRLGWTAAYDPDLPSTFLEDIDQRLAEGVAAFEEFFGLRPVAFAPPALGFPGEKESLVEDLGFQGIDLPFTQPVVNSRFRFRIRPNWPGKRVGESLRVIVRNVIFEPNSGRPDPVGLAMRQIETAFRWSKPAIISSHRVNFGGVIEKRNRELGLETLQALLRAIIDRWSDVEFVGMDELLANGP
ncbi:MAG: hypothetical protein JJU31_08690 [Wenzhouxiangella sp.]|nr:hypothetical protein [Wenzhouxiangella sp.]